MYLQTIATPLLGEPLGELEPATVEAIEEAKKQLRRRLRAGDDKAISDRSKRLRRAFASTARSDRPALLARLRRRRSGDELSELFHRRISGGLRKRMLRVLESDETPDQFRDVEIPQGWWPNAPTHVTINISKARRRNRYWRRKLGWRGHSGKIRAQLVHDLGLKLPRGWTVDLEHFTAAWQRQKGLKVDGVIGPKTWRKLRLAMGMPVECTGYESGEVSASRKRAGILSQKVFPLANADGVMVTDFPVNSASHRNKSQVRKELAKLIERWADTDDGAYRLEIRGYSDCVGSERNNLRLRRARAEAVRDLLGPAAARVTVAAPAPAGRYVNGPEATANESRRDRAMNRGAIIKALLDFGGTVIQPDIRVPVDPDRPKGKGKGRSRGSLQVPEIGIKRKIKLLEKEFDVPGGWLVMTIKGFVEIEGALRLRDPRTKVKFDLASGKAQFEAKLGKELIEASFTGSIEGGKLSGLGIKLGTESIEVSVDAKANLREPFTVKLKPRKIFVGELERGPWKFIGKVRPALELVFRPTAKAALTTARAARSATTAVRVVARGVFYGGQVGAATTAGAVIVGTSVALVSIAAVGAGLYMLHLSHRDGRAWSAGYSFGKGYSDALASLTEADFPNELSASDKRLAASNWESEFNEKADRWINHEDRAALGTMSRLGRAAILQDYLLYRKKYGTFGWLKLAQQHRRRYGARHGTRAERYWTIIREQVRRGKPFGIKLAPPSLDR